MENQNTLLCCIGVTLVICFLMYRYLRNRTITLEKFNDHTVEY